MSEKSSAPLIDRLGESMDDFTDAERLIANFILTNRQAVPFETAASLAVRLNISAVTVGRFSRRMGYRNFRDLKGALKFDHSALPWASGEQLDHLIAGSDTGADLQRDFDLTVAGIREVYHLARTAKWDAIVQLFVDAEEVLVAGFQTERGLAAHFAHTLQYARPSVRLVDLAGGHFADVLAEDARRRVLLIVETRRHSRQAQTLAAEAKAAGIAIVFVTDKYCPWARRYTPLVLPLATESAIFWDTMVPIVSALTLLANAVAIKLSPSAEPRLARISALYQGFTGHVGQPRGQRSRKR